MNTGFQESPSLEIWLQDVQSYLFRILQEPMRQAGFDARKSSFTFHRKNKKNLDLLSIIFVSQFPLSYRVSYQLEIWNPQIKEIKKSFMGDILHKDSDLCSIILFTKDFAPGDPDEARVKDFLIRNGRELFNTGGALVQTLQEELIPLCDAMDSIDSMDRYFLSNPNWALDSRSGGNVCTDLITCKLNRKRDIHFRYQELMRGLNEKIESRLMNTDSRELLTLCYEAIK